MISIIVIERNVFNTSIKTFYFNQGEAPTLRNDGAAIIGYLHSSVHRPSLRRFETNQIDLLQSEEKLLLGTNSSTRRQIRRAMEKGFELIALDSPTDSDLIRFKDFYNAFARDKRTDLCNEYHLETMKLLREQNALMITYLQDSDGETLCYRVYITDGHLVNNLYSASHFRLKDDQPSKKI